MNKTHNYNHETQQGFTIVELLIAMTVFSIVLIAASAGLIQIGRSYYRGVITTRTQDTNRAIITELADAVKFSGRGTQPIIETDGDGQAEVICVGNTRYSVYIGNQVSTAGDRGLFRDQTASSGCERADGTVAGQELLGENMRVNRLEITDIGNERYRITTWIAYGDDDVFDPNITERKTCLGTRMTSGFCAVSELSTVVSKRIL